MPVQREKQSFMSEDCVGDWNLCGMEDIVGQ